MAADLGARRGLPTLLIIIGALVGFHMKVSNKLGWISESNTEYLLAMPQIRCKNVIGGVTACLEHQINIKVESDISYEGIRPLVMAARTAIDIIAASSDAVKQGDRLDEIPAAELSIGEEVLIRPWDVWLGNTRHHRTGLVYNARKENISKQGIHPFGMTTRPANDEFAAGNNTVQQGDRLGEVSAVGLSISPHPPYHFLGGDLLYRSACSLRR